MPTWSTAPMIFGTGYAPFRGGPLNYARSRGVRGCRLDACARSLQVRRPVHARCRLGEFQVTPHRFAGDLSGHDRHPSRSRPPLANRTARRSLHPHAGDAGRHQPQRRHFRRLAAQPDGYRRWRVRIQGRQVPHRDGRDRGDEFPQTVYVGDLVSVHANLVRIGTTSITVHLEAWVVRRKEMQSILVTDGNFTYVSIDDQGHPQAIKQDPPPISA